MRPALALVVVATLSIALLLPSASSTETEDAIARGLDWLRAQQAADGSVGGADGSAWSALAFRAAGVDPATVRLSAASPSLTDYLASSCGSLGDLATSWARYVLAVVAAAGPEAAQDFCGLDPLAELLAFWDGSQFGDAALLNDDYFALLALRAAGVPNDAPAVQTTREWVLANQQPNGGWSWGVLGPSNPFFAFALGADVDDTAAAMQALALTVTAAPLDEARTDLAATRGALFIKHLQNLFDGGCGGSNAGAAFDAAFGGRLDGNADSNADSTSWALMALNVRGEDAQGPGWTTPNGQTPVSYLLSLQREDGSFVWKYRDLLGGPEQESFQPVSTTAWAALALAGGSFVVVP